MIDHVFFGVLSNNAINAAGVVYLLAFVAFASDLAISRTRSSSVRERELVAADGATVPAAGADTSAASGDTGGSAGSAERAERAELAGRIGMALTVLATAIHLVAVVARGLANDPVRVPWGNMYEFTITASFVVSLTFLLLVRRFSLRWLGVVVTGFQLVVLMAAVVGLYLPAAPLTPALDSPWLVIHVVAAIIATGVFTLGGMFSILYLVRERAEKRGTLKPGGFLSRVPDLRTLDRLSYRMHAIGFPVWTFGALIAGPIWAQQAWTRYWGWDPKEVWAFITWVVYAAYLHARATAGWKGQAAAIVALVGLATLWFNFIGINYFFGTSIHSYAE